MHPRIVECVPNFSEGKDLSKIRRITERIESVPGIKLLDVSPGFDAQPKVIDAASNLLEQIFGEQGRHA